MSEKINTQKYLDYILDETKKLLAIDSPSGFTEKAASYVMDEYAALGYTPVRTTKGGVFCEISRNSNKRDSLMMEAHMDTLGAMVCEIQQNGYLKLSPIGGMNANNAEAENCRIYTRDGKIYTGTFQLCDASIHVNDKFDETSRSFDVMEVVLDEKVTTKEDTLALGILPGDIVCFDPRTTITENGYIKSRFLDDKLSVGILLGFAKFIKDEKITLPRTVYHHITVYEEVGHGGAASIPSDVAEVLSVDMGCVGNGISCTEHQVSICAKDSRGPYTYDVVTNLIHAAKRQNLDFAVDVYPYYGSDADVALTAGHDVKHGLIGTGVYASHGYERSHMDGVLNTFLLLTEYVK
ncbi:MAG: M42 family metallopeptidase [Lachnospiraceae bacterium]|nr:M42 family metallopeptidase [Lachnospiraceae bacterium]